MAKPNRGDSAGKACGTSYLFPLHYSLKTFPFPHRFVLSRSTNCESLSHGYAVPAPFSKGAFGVQRRSPPCQRGVPRHRRGGGIPQAGRFPHRFVLSRSANCESLSHGYAVPAPFGKGALRAVPADNAHGNLLRIVTSLTRPVSLPSRMGKENAGTLHVLTAAARRPFGKGAFGGVKKQLPTGELFGGYGA